MHIKMPYTKKKRLHPEAVFILDVKTFSNIRNVGKFELVAYHDMAAYELDPTDILDVRSYTVNQPMTDAECYQYALECVDTTVTDEEGATTYKAFFEGAELIP